jgi:hypothetical protein
MTGLVSLDAIQENPQPVIDKAHEMRKTHFAISEIKNDIPVEAMNVLPFGRPNS